MTVLVQPSPWIRYQFFDANGDPLAFGLIYTFAAGTNTPAATYTDHTGGVANSNPIVLDAGGYADIWLTASSYKISVHDAADVPLYTIDGLPGVGSILTVGSLPPIFTSSLAGGALTFTLSNAAAGTLLGNFTGSAAPPTYGVIGSDKQVTFNNAGKMSGSANLLFDDSLKKLTVGAAVQIFVDGGGPKIIISNTSQPLMFNASGAGWFLTSQNNQDIRIGPANDPDSFVFSSGASGVFTLPPGTLRLGTGSSLGRVYLNNGTSSASVFAGAQVICGNLATPEGVVDAETGSTYQSTNGGAATTFWVKESSPTTNTGWIGK